MNERSVVIFEMDCSRISDYIIILSYHSVILFMSLFAFTVFLVVLKINFFILYWMVFIDQTIKLYCISIWTPEICFAKAMKSVPRALHFNFITSLLILNGAVILSALILESLIKSKVDWLLVSANVSVSTY